MLIDAPIRYDGTPSAGVPVIGCAPAPIVRDDEPSANTASDRVAVPVKACGAGGDGEGAGVLIRHVQAQRQRRIGHRILGGFLPHRGKVREDRAPLRRRRATDVVVVTGHAVRVVGASACDRPHMQGYGGGDVRITRLPTTGRGRSSVPRAAARTANPAGDGLRAVGLGERESASRSAQYACRPSTSVLYAPRNPIPMS